MSLFSGIRKKLESFGHGVVAQVNPFDNGATYSNPKPQPRPPVQPQVQAPRSNFSRGFDQINPFDNGRSFGNNNPTTTKSVWQQTQPALKSVWDGFKQAPDQIGKGYGEISGQSQRAREAEALQQQSTLESMQRAVKQREQTLDPIKRARLTEQINAQGKLQKEGYKQFQRNQNEFIQNTDPAKMAASTASVGLDLATAGVGTAGAAGATAGQLARQAATSAALAAPSGALSPLISKGKDATLKDVLTGAATAAVIGGAIPLATSAASKALPKVAAKGAEIAKTADSALTKTAETAQLRDTYKLLQQQFDNTTNAQTRKVLNRQMTDVNAQIRKTEQGGYIGGGKPKVTATDKAIQKRLNERPANLRKIEQTTTNMSDAERLKLAKGDVGQAGIGSDPAALAQARAKMQAAIEADKGVINPEAPSFLQVNKSDIKPVPEGKYRAPETPISKGVAPSGPQGIGVIPLDKLGKTDVVKEAEQRLINGKVTKDATVKDVLQGISKQRGAANVESSLAAASIKTKAKELGIKADRNFIDKYQAGKLTTPAEKELGQHVRGITDELFKKQQALDPTIQYRQNYIPQSYAQPADQVAEAIGKLEKNTGAAKRRSFNTYKEAEAFGLTPKHQSLDQIIGESAGKAERVVQNRAIVKQGLEGGIFTTKQTGVPLTGVLAPDGSQVYAAKNVADVINGVLQKDTHGLPGAISKVAHSFGVAQDVMLQGGVPGTNANFFVAGQAVKDTTRNIGKAATLSPIQAVKQEGHLLGDLVRGTAGTQKRFAEGSFKAAGQKISNPEFLRQLAKEGLYIQPQTSLTGEGRNVVARNWNKLGNNPTFGRYMPNRMLSTAQEVYAQSVKKLGHDKALKLAAETTKTFTGQVDQILKGRSGLSEDIASIALFAPKYRESIITALHNVVKSTYPKNWMNPAFKPSRELLAGMAVTLAGYEALNRKLTGHSMLENRKGQELSVEIPYGEKDAKGNQPVVNIPFMPGFMTIPRAIVAAGNAATHGDVKGIVAEAGKSLSAPLQNITAVAGNRDYFGNPIYIDEATARTEGVNPDNPLTAGKKIAGYVGGQLSPSWVRGGIQAAQGKPAGQSISTALEAPLKFGKRPNPETVAYFDRRDKFVGGLDKNEQTLFNKLNPTKKDIRGGNIKETSTLTKASDYGDLVANQSFADKYQAYQKSSPKHDPLWDLDRNDLRSYMQAQIIGKNDPGGDSTTTRKLYARLPKDFFSKREKYFADMQKSGVKFTGTSKPNTGMPKELAAFSDNYHNLPYGTGARSAALRSPQGVAYIAWLEKNKIRNNQERADLGLPPLEDSSSKYAGGGSKGYRGGGGRSKKAVDPAKFAISRNAGQARAVSSTIKKPKVTAKVASNPNYKPRARGKGKLVKSKV